MIWLIVLVFAGVSAVLYIAIGTSGTTTPTATKVAELARITYAAAIFAIMFALTLGLHDAFVRVVK
jgi:hypothetical protein